MGMLWFGVVMGMLLLVAKYCSFWLLTGGPVQYKLPRWILFGRLQPVRDRIHESTFLLFLVDVVGGYAGMHVLSAFGGSIIAMVAMTSYTIACMTILMWHFVIDWAKKKCGSMLPAPQKRRRYARC